MLVVSTHLKNISQIGSFPQVGAKMKKYVKPPPSLMLHLLFMAKGKHEGLVVQPHGIDWMIFLPNSWDFWRRNPGPKPKIHRSLTLTSST